MSDSIQGAAALAVAALLSLAVVIPLPVMAAGEDPPQSTAQGSLETDLLPDVANLLVVTDEVDEGDYRVMMDALERWEANPTLGTAKRLAVAARQAAETLTAFDPYPCASEYHNALLMGAWLYHDTFTQYSQLLPEQQEAREQGQPAVESWYDRAGEWVSQAESMRDAVYDECLIQAKDAYGLSYAYFGQPEPYLASANRVAPAEGWVARRYSLSTVAGALEVYSAYRDGDYAAMVDTHAAWEAGQDAPTRRSAAAALKSAAATAADTLRTHHPYPCYREYWSALYSAALAMEGAFDYLDLKSDRKARKLGRPASKEALQRAYGWHARAIEADVVQACADLALEDYLEAYRVFGDPSRMFRLVDTGLTGVKMPVER